MISADSPARVNPEESHLTVLLDFSPKVGKGGGVEICNGQVVWEHLITESLQLEETNHYCDRVTFGMS